MWLHFCELKPKPCKVYTKTQNGYAILCFGINSLKNKIAAQSVAILFLSYKKASLSEAFLFVTWLRPELLEAVLIAQDQKPNVGQVDGLQRKY